MGFYETQEANYEYRKSMRESYNEGYEQGKADAAPKWIPISERLPEEGQRCLVCDNGWFSIDTFVGHGNPYNWKLYVRDYEAWMPLPEPWEGEQHETD